MVKTSELSLYLKAEQCHDGDIIVFVGAGKVVDKTFKEEGLDKKRRSLEIPVKLRGHEKIYTPNNTTINFLSAVWGEDTDNWVGKEARINLMPGNFGKMVIIAKPV